MKHLALLLLTSCTLEASLGKSQGPSSQPALGATRWSIVLGLSSDEMVARNGLVFASDGDVIAGGGRQLGDGRFTGFISRRSSSDGSPEWTIPLEGPAPATSDVFAVTTSGSSIIAVGSFMGTIDFGGETRSTSTTTPGVIPASFDIFVASYAADGALQWVRTLGCTVMATGDAVGVSGDTIYVGGHYSGLVDVGQGPVGEPTNWQQQGDGLLLAYSLSGEFRWGRRFAGGTIIDDLVVLPDGDVLISGNTSAGTSFGGAPMSDRGQFLARFSPDGAHQMSKVSAGGAGDFAMGLAVVDDGNVIVSRQRLLRPTYQNERSLVDNDGIPVWTEETSNIEGGHPVAHAPGFVLGGHVTGLSGDPGSGTLPLNTLYVAAYDLAGDVVDVRSYGTQTNVGPTMRTITSAPSGELAFAVRFSEPIDFDLGLLTPTGHSLAIVLLDAP
jgi:hypothetical protein